MTIYEDFEEIQKENIKTSDSIKNFNINENDKLYVIICVFSPFGKDERTKLAQDFVNRIEKCKEDGHPIQLCVVELLYPNQKKFLNIKDKEYHLQIKYNHEIYLFNKENLINVGIQKLLPMDWKYVAWIDADVEFLDKWWVEKTIHLFKTQNLDVVQLYAICRFLNEKNIPSNYFYSSLNVLSNSILLKQKKYRHPGFAWACSRNAYEKMGGLFEYAIVGGGDMIMECCWTNRLHLLEKRYEPLQSFVSSIKEFQEKVKHFQLGYLNVIIQHYYHGERKNRMYVDRNTILINNEYNPKNDLIRPFEHNNFSFLVPTFEFYKKIETQIKEYFLSRKEE